MTSRSRLCVPWIVGVAAVISTSCASSSGSEAPTTSTPQTVPDADYVSALNDAKNGSLKADQNRPCGESSCEWQLCGYTCSAGKLCDKKCVAKDTRPESYVKFTVSGDVSTQADSKSVPYDPWMSLDNVVIYGCQMWVYRNQAGAPDHEAVQLHFAELYQGAFATKDVEVSGRKLLVDVSHFTGPGQYKAGAMFYEDSQARKDGHLYSARPAIA